MTTAFSALTQPLCHFLPLHWSREEMLLQLTIAHTCILSLTVLVSILGILSGWQEGSVHSNFHHVQTLIYGACGWNQTTRLVQRTIASCCPCSKSSADTPAGCPDWPVCSSSALKSSKPSRTSPLAAGFPLDPNFWTMCTPMKQEISKGSLTGLSWHDRKNHSIQELFFISFPWKIHSTGHRWDMILG